MGNGNLCLVGGDWNMCYFSIGNFISPIDEVIFFRGVGQPPARMNMPMGDFHGDFLGFSPAFVSWDVLFKVHEMGY